MLRDDDADLASIYGCIENDSDFPVIRNGRESSRLSPENPMLKATMPRGYSVSFLHPYQVKGRGSL